MSQGLSQTAIIDFDAQVKAAYQGQGVLRPTVRVKSGVTGATVKFRRIKRGMATRRIPQTDIVPMGQGYGEETATLSDWNAGDYTDIFDQQKTNIDDKAALATNIAAAIGRREDQLILDALDAASPAAPVGVNIGGANTGLNMAKLRAAKRVLDARAVPQKDRYFVHSAIGLEQLLGLTEVTSADFNAVRTLANGEVKTFLGFNFVMIEDREEGGLALAGTTRTNFAYDKQALGLAVGLEKRTSVDWIPEKTSWLANGVFSAGAVAIDPDGVIEVATVEA